MVPQSENRTSYRMDRLIHERVHDPYKTKSKLPEPTVQSSWAQNWDKILIKGQNLRVFSQDMRCGRLGIGRNYYMIANDIEILWGRLDEFDEFPWNGTIVVIAHDKDPLRWAYLPIDATRQDVEGAFSRGYCWYGPAVCQATKVAEGKIIDQWSFMIEPFVHELA